MCFFRIGTSQLWQDEHATWWATQLSTDDFLRLLRNVDVVLAPYYIFMRGFTRLFGDSELALRAPSALAMGACASCVAVLGTRLFGLSTGLRAGLIFSLVPLVSRYGQEARPYAFVTLFATLSTLLLLRALERPNGGRWFAYGAALIGVGLSHLLALSLLLAHGVWVLKSPEKRSARPRWLTTVTVVGLLLLPILVIGAKQSGQIQDIPLALPTARNFSRSLGTEQPALQLLLALALVVALCLRRIPWGLRLWAVVPLLFLVATHFAIHMFRLRYVVFTVPAWVLAVAALLEPRLNAPRRAAWSTALAVLALATLCWNKQLSLRTQNSRVGTDYRTAARELMTRAQPGDVISFAGERGGLRHARIALAYQLRNGPRLPDIFVAESMQERGLFGATECADARLCLPPDVKRLWLVSNAAAADLYRGIPESRKQIYRDVFYLSDVVPVWNGTLSLWVAKQQRADARSYLR